MLLNTTRNKVISEKEITCKNIFSQIRGLMFRKKQNLIMEFPEERKISLHNCFVFFTTDVLILDKEMKIVEIKRDFKPFRFWNASQKGKYVVELGIKKDSDEKREYDVGEKVGIRY